MIEPLSRYGKINIVIEKDKHGYYAYCPELPGCQSQGETFEEIAANIREAAELYLETPFHAGKMLHPKIVKQVSEAVREV